MKNKLFKLMLLVAMFIIVSFSVSAQLLVQLRPAVPVKVKPVQPGPDYIWVKEDWVPGGNTNRFSEGYWAKPPQAGYSRLNGYWVSSSRGHSWVPGKWYKKQPVNNGNHYGQYKGNQKEKP